MKNQKRIDSDKYDDGCDADGDENYKNKHYNKYKQKENSGQLQLYKIKKNILQNTQPIMYLSDGTCISVDALPFLNESLYRQKYGNSLDYLFNTQ